MIFTRLSILFALIRSKGPSLILLYLLVIGSTLMESIGIASFYPIVEILQDRSQLENYKDKMVAWVPALEYLDSEQFLFYSLLGIGALFVFKNIFLVLAEYGNIRVITHLYRSWMNRIFNVYMNKPYSYFAENKAGDLVQRKIMQANKTSDALRIFITFLGGVTNILGVFCVLCLINLKVTITITLLMLPSYFLTMKLSREKIYSGGNRLVELEKQGFEITTEVLSGIRQVKIFCAEEYFQKQIGKIWLQHSRYRIQNQFLVTLPRPILETLIVLGGVITLMIFENVFGQGKEFFPVLAVFAIGFYRIFPLSAASSANIMSLANLLPSAETVADILSTEVAMKTQPSLPPMSKKIELQNVSFSYDNREEVLENMTLTFENNKFYGIVGVSGSGKSTIIDLIAGFIKPQNGKILIDGLNLNNINIKTWRSQIGLISQDDFIFSGTIEDNICFGVDDKVRDQNRIQEVARMAYIDEFIKSLPAGYKTMVGERGVKLSGGQRQRLSIARAIYLDPSILIFDEATSSLDANSEIKVQEAIETTLHGKRTVIVIAHRLATLSKADYIYVIDNGKIIEEGTHKTLKYKNGLYSRLCEKQSLH